MSFQSQSTKVRNCLAWHAVLALLLAWVAVSDVGAEPATVVTECGETVARGQTAYLLSDLDCSGSATPGVILSHRARLLLGGHSIVGDPRQTDEEGALLQGVRCATGSVCTVEGPGAIAGFSASGVAGTRVRLRDVSVTHNGVAGISAFENVRLRNVSVSDNGTLAIHAGGQVHGASNSEGEVVQWHAPRFRPGDS